MPVTASLNTYATWDNAANTYASLEAAPTYGVLEGARLLITRTLPSSGSVLIGRFLNLSFGGTLGASGTLPRQVGRKLLGALASSAVVLINKTLNRSFGGTLTSSGVVNRLQLRGFVVRGTLAPTGNSTLRLLYTFYISLDAHLRMFGTLQVRMVRGPWPPFVRTAKTRAPELVASSSTSAPELQPASKLKWPPFNALPR